MHDAHSRTGTDALDLFDPDISDLIRRSAGKLSRSSGFSAHERDDIEQELLLDLLTRRDRFDPGKASATGFATMLIKRKVVSLVRHRRAQRRDPSREERSLDSAIEDGDGRMVAFHESVSSADDFGHSQLRGDIATLVEGLPLAARAEATRLWIACTNGERSRACQPAGAHLEVIQRELAPLLDRAPNLTSPAGAFA